MRYRGLKAAVVLAAVAIGLAAGLESREDWRAATVEWPLAGGDWFNTRYSTLDRITTANVKNLRGAWTTNLPGESSRAAPVMQGGLLFLPGGTHLFALDAKTGAIVWTYAADRGAFSRMGAAVGEGLVFIGLGERLAAVNQRTGALAWMYQPPDRPAQGISGPPTYLDGMVVAGISDGDKDLRSRVVGLDAKTGREVWRFNVVPGPGEFGHDTWPKNSTVWKYGGGAVWMVPAVDPDLGLVYFATGNPAPQWGGEIRRGDNLFTEAVVALDVKTGVRRWHRQLIHHDIWEYDMSTPLVLYDATVDGRTRKALAAMRTDGYMFLLDRATGAPVLPIEERPVKQDSFAGTAPTQPFPVGADRMGPDCVLDGVLPPGFERGCYFEPIRTDMPNHTSPTPSARFAPMAYSPQTRYFYATGCVNVWWTRRSEDPWFFNGTFVRIPGAKRSGVIAAFDSRTNKIVWQKRVPYPICGGGGALATAGGLMFHPEPDGNIQAYDAMSGDLLWQFQVGILPPMGPLGPYDGPMATYEIDGVQMVVATAGRAVWAFKLGGPLEPRAAPPPPPTEEPFPGGPEDTSTIRSGTTFVQTIPHINYRKEWKYEYGVEPVQARVKRGTVVTWTNGGNMAHTFVARDRSWRAGPIAPGGSATVTLDKPGTYDYTCEQHPWTIARLIVQ